MNTSVLCSRRKSCQAGVIKNVLGQDVTNQGLNTHSLKKKERKKVTNVLARRKTHNQERGHCVAIGILFPFLSAHFIIYATYYFPLFLCCSQECRPSLFAPHHMCETLFLICIHSNRAQHCQNKRQ